MAQPGTWAFRRTVLDAQNAVGHTATVEIHHHLVNLAESVSLRVFHGVPINWLHLFIFVGWLDAASLSLLRSWLGASSWEDPPLAPPRSIRPLPRKRLR